MKKQFEQKVTAKEMIEKFVSSFISQLEQIKMEGTKVSWDKGFKPLLNAFYNPVTKNQYHGGNVFVAWLYLYLFGYTDTRFITWNNAFKLAKDFGINLKDTKIIPYEKFQGQKVPMFHYSIFEKETNEKDDNGQPIVNKYRFIKYFEVLPVEAFSEEFQNCFNEKFPIEKVNKEIPKEFQEIVTWGTGNVGVEIEYREAVNAACYYPALHKIVMPYPQQYFTQNRAIATFFHELAHATGKTLKRELDATFGSASYAKEELIAEMTAIVVLNILGEEVPEKSFAYILNWLKSNNPQTIWGILSKVQNAVGLIFGESPKEFEKEGEEEAENIPA